MPKHFAALGDLTQPLRAAHGNPDRVSGRALLAVLRHGVVARVDANERALAPPTAILRLNATAGDHAAASAFDQHELLAVTLEAISPLKVCVRHGASPFVGDVRAV